MLIRRLSGRTSLSFAAALSAVLALAASAPALAVEPPHVSGQLIVGFQEGTADAVRATVHANLGAVLIRPLARGKMDLVRLPASSSLADRQAEYLAHPTVAFAHPNYHGEGGFLPDDTYFDTQWHLKNTGQGGGTPGADIEAEDGWDYTRGDASVVVAVLDTGIDSDHPEFAARIVAGWDFVNGDADPEDDHGHGTNVTGLLAANTDNAFGVAGVDHYCMIMPIKVLDQNNVGLTSDLIDGIDFASANGADVLSMSLINYPGTGGLNTALRDAKLAGSILVACAGNGGIGNADVSYPGASPHTISIGTTDRNDARAWYSATGSALEFVSPGDDVITTRYNSSADTYSVFGGCSAATPVTAGIVSILRALNPDLRTRNVRDLLEWGAEDQVGPPGEDTPGWDQYFGYGRVNLRATVEAYLTRTAIPLAQAESGTEELLRVAAAPNPASSVTTIRFTVPIRSWVHITIHDVGGRATRDLGTGLAEAGSHDICWDGRDDEGRSVAAGIYFVRVQTNERAAATKIILLN